MSSPLTKLERNEMNLISKNESTESNIQIPTIRMNQRPIAPAPIESNDLSKVNKSRGRPKKEFNPEAAELTSLFLQSMKGSTNDESKTIRPPKEILPMPGQKVNLPPYPAPPPPQMKHRNPFPPNTIYKANYCGNEVWEIEINGTICMRRIKDSWLNVTHILKVANVEKPKRTRILEKEIFTKQHEKVQGGYGKYQGTWVPFEIGKKLAERHNVYEALKLLLELDPTHAINIPHKKPGGTFSRRAYSVKNSKRAKPDTNNSSFESEGKSLPRAHTDAMELLMEAVRISPKMKTKATSLKESKTRKDNENTKDEAISHSYDKSSANPVSNKRTKASENPSNKVSNKKTTGGKIITSAIAEAANQAQDKTPTRTFTSFESIIDDPYLSKARIKLLNAFCEGDETNEPLPLKLMEDPDFLKFDLRSPLDSKGHTALHFVAGTGRFLALIQLIKCGADPTIVNNEGVTSLMRTVQYRYAFDLGTFKDILSILKSTLFQVDNLGRSVLHYCALSGSQPGYNLPALYYLKTILELLKSNLEDEAISKFINITDLSGNTVAHIAAQCKLYDIIKVLFEMGANLTIKNNESHSTLDCIPAEVLSTAFIVPQYSNDPSFIGQQHSMNSDYILKSNNLNISYQHSNPTVNNPKFLNHQTNMTNFDVGTEVTNENFNPASNILSQDNILSQGSIDDGTHEEFRIEQVQDALRRYALSIEAKFKHQLQDKDNQIEILTRQNEFLTNKLEISLRTLDSMRAATMLAAGTPALKKFLVPHSTPIPEDSAPAPLGREHGPNSFHSDQVESTPLNETDMMTQPTELASTPGLAFSNSAPIRPDTDSNYNANKLRRSSSQSKSQQLPRTDNSYSPMNVVPSSSGLGATFERDTDHPTELSPEVDADYEF